MAGIRRTEIVNALRERLFSGIHLGTLAQGMRLPPVRDLAREFGADPRVVLAAYRDLEKEGLVEIRPRSGIFLATTGRRPEEFLRRSADWIVDTFILGLKHGISAPHLPNLLRRALETRRLRCVCLECNLDQIDELCRELQTDYGLDTIGLDCADVVATGHCPPELLSADVLVTTHLHRHKLEPVAERLQKPLITVALRPALFSEIERMLAKGTVYIVVVDERYAGKLRRIFASSPGIENLQVLEVGEAGIEARIAAIPEKVPLYMTPLAREKLGPGLDPPGDLPDLRSFSSDSARPILSFIVRMNTQAMT